MIMFELRLAYTYVPMKKKSCNEGLVNAGGLNGLKMIFALLTKVIAVYV